MFLEKGGHFKNPRAEELILGIDATETETQICHDYNRQVEKV